MDELLDFSFVVFRVEIVRLGVIGQGNEQLVFGLRTGGVEALGHREWNERVFHAVDKKHGHFGVRHFLDWLNRGQAGVLVREEQGGDPRIERFG